MTKPTKNDTKIDVLGFFRELAATVEKTKNVTLEPRLLNSLEYIEKEYEEKFYQRNVKESTKHEKNKNIVDQVEVEENSKTIEAKAQNSGNETKNTQEIEVKDQGIEIE